MTLCLEHSFIRQTFAIFQKKVSVEEVKDAVKKELEGPGRLLGYHAMYQKVRKEYNPALMREYHRPEKYLLT